jgi:hypothetical protein
MKSSRFFGLALAAMVGGMGALAATPLNAMPRAIIEHRTQRDLKAQRRMIDSGSYWGKTKRRGPGWSNRHVQRMAAKRRNRANNRRAHRG